jgi:hypothetical protein
MPVTHNKSSFSAPSRSFIWGIGEREQNQTCWNPWDWASGLGLQIHLYVNEPGWPQTWDLPASTSQFGSVRLFICTLMDYKYFNM